jgi:threonyl-tRNA synthetase
MSITVVGEKLESQQVSDTTTGLDLFGDDKTIVAVRVDGELRDLSRPLLDGREGLDGAALRVEPVSNAEPDGLAILRHSAAHVAAQAVQAAHPEAKLGIGPPITDGFYYDFDLAEPFTPGDLRELE